MQQALEALEEGLTMKEWRELVAALREALAQEHAMHELARLGQEIEREPSEWREMVVVSLVREGIDKHRARELADHFAAQPEPPPEWEAIDNIIAEYGLQAIDFVADWKAAQRPWQGLTDEDVNKESAMIASQMKLAFHAGMYVAQQILKERNNE
jgi:hypothetical protein